MAELLRGWGARAADRQGVRRSRPGYGAARAVGLGLGAVLVSGSAVSMAPSMLVQDATETLEMPAAMASMTSLTVRAPRGDVTVTELGAGGQPQVAVDTWWTLNRPSAALQDHGDGSWTLQAHCEGANLGRCGIGLSVLVPEGTDLTVIGTLGDVAVTSTGAVDVRSTTGNLSVAGAPTVVSATSTFGDVLVDSGVAPRSVTVRSTAGNIDVLLPRSQDYDVLAQTTHGDRSVTLPVRSGAPHTVTARSTFGSLDLAPTG